MTVVTGTVVDVSGQPLDGVLWAQVTEFRSDGTNILAPRRIPIPITNGEVSADLAPGPARLTIDAGSGRQTFTVTIPDTGPVTLAALIGEL